MYMYKYMLAERHFCNENMALVLDTINEPLLYVVGNLEHEYPMRIRKRALGIMVEVWKTLARLGGTSNSAHPFSLVLPLDFFLLLVRAPSHMKAPSRQSLFGAWPRD